MEERLTGRRGELLRLGLAARNWLLSQMSDDDSLMNWKLSEDSRTANEIATHVAWAIGAVCAHLSEELGIQLDSLEQETNDGGVESDIRQSYRLFKEILYKMADEMLDRWSTLPPPAKLREGSVETILRIIAGYHAFHHGGQIAYLIKRARKQV
ncbi:MAG: DinB family protein [Candidatus Thorarchaeota archaeon]